MDAKDLLEKYRQARQTKLNELKELDGLIRRLEADLGESNELSPSDQGEIAELISQAISVTPTTSTVKDTGVRPDEYFGMTHGDAARKYLEKIGRATSMEQLVEALRKGGCKVGGVDPKKTLYISLVRNTRDFVPIGNGYIGLRKFYPNLKSAEVKKSKKK